MCMRLRGLQLQAVMRRMMSLGLRSRPMPLLRALHLALLRTLSRLLLRRLCRQVSLRLRTGRLRRLLLGMLPALVTVMLTRLRLSRLHRPLRGRLSRRLWWPLRLALPRPPRGQSQERLQRRFASEFPLHAEAAGSRRCVEHVFRGLRDVTGAGAGHAMADDKRARPNEQRPQSRKISWTTTSSGHPPTRPPLSTGQLNAISRLP